MASGSVSTLLVRPVVMMLLGHEAALGALYVATDLTPEIVADPDARVTPAQLCVAWSELARHTGDPQVALRMAASIPPGAFGVVEYLCRCAPTLGEALRQWVRFLNLLDDAVEVALEVEDDEARVRVVAESDAPAPLSHELCFALLHAQARASCEEPYHALRVDFTHRAKGDTSAYEKWFDAPVRFGVKETQLVLTRAQLEAKLVSADPTLHAILLRSADEQQREGAARGPALTAQVKRTLQKALRDGATEIDEVARRLGMSGRSLQRRLRDEGTTFQAVREEARRDLARHYLTIDLSVSEISFMLGFSEPSAFFRAFKRWTGQTPEESRRQSARGHSIVAREH